MLTHYYNKNAEPLLSISEIDCTSLIDMLSQQVGKAYIRFKNYKWYLKQRNATEKWLACLNVVVLMTLEYSLNANENI